MVRVLGFQVEGESSLLDLNQEKLNIVLEVRKY